MRCDPKLLIWLNEQLISAPDALEFLSEEQRRRDREARRDRKVRRKGDRESARHYADE